MNQKITNPEDIPLAFQIAWNNHDMKAFAALFHQDATFVNRFNVVPLIRPLNSVL
ncbi:hypothetical protein [Acinetobacter seifertii]|uniref:hypothetical protein n=1 Tax=Acinetobacter seifertii TaxID=1530123 RepID=UPI003D6D90CB